jgi:hypothetical protein
LASNAHLSLSERKAELDEFSKNFDRRLSEINHIIGLLHDPSTKERFILQEKLERASFNANSNKILAILLEEEKAENAAKEIRTLFRQSQIEEHAYKRYSNEWHSRAVRDNRYFALDPKASDKIERIKAVENKKWSELHVKFKTPEYSAAELKNEAQQLQNELDKHLALSFELTQDRDKNRDR